jgi:TonB family protein
MMVTSAHEGNYATLLSEVSSQWEDGHPDKAIAMLEEAVCQYSFKGLNGHKEHVVLADLITALSYSDLPKAQARYDAWVKAFPVSPIKNPLDTLRLPVNTRLLVLQGKSAEARAFVTAEAATRDAMQAEHQARIAAEIQAKTRKKGEYRDQDFVFDRTMSGYSRAIRLSEFILESHERGEAAFADFTAQGRNPFFETTSSMTLHSSIKLSCASSGLTINDWLIVDIGFDRDGRNAIALPFAASSPAAIQPLLEALGDANISIGGMRDVTERTKLLLRCTRATPQAPDILADYSYMRGYFLPMVANTKAAANYNIFTDPPSNLVRDKEWLVLLNYAYAPHTLRPEKFVPTQAALLGALQAMPTPDPVAIAIVQHWMLPDAPTGQNQRLRNILPLYIDSVAKLKDVPGMPPRVRAYLEFKLGEMHETLGEPVAAEALYRAIVARSPAELPDKSSEVTRARLRLAAIAEASGRYSESAALFDALGLSPEQCSLYQARPAITSFKSPDYPVAALRNEVQGNVDFEFDLDATGKPTNFRVLASTPPFVFDKDTIRSFSKASFAPATRGGKALPCEAATQTFTWRVAD